MKNVPRARRGWSDTPAPQGPRGDVRSPSQTVTVRSQGPLPSPPRLPLSQRERGRWARGNREERYLGTVSYGIVAPLSAPSWVTLCSLSDFDGTWRVPGPVTRSVCFTVTEHRLHPSSLREQIPNPGQDSRGILRSLGGRKTWMLWCRNGYSACGSECRPLLLKNHKHFICR